jgi:cytochrome c biogenesis protein CcdA
MNSFLVGLLSSFSLGAITVIHPCPLSTNMVAVSLLYGIQRGSNRGLKIVLLFVVGEIVMLVGLSMLISIGFLNLPGVANILQVYMQQLLGPILILVGMMFSGILLPKQQTLKISAFNLKANSKFTVLGSFFLGNIIALSFCPLTAAVFFGLLIPLTVTSQSVVLYPVFYGIGSTLPLLLIVFFISRSTILLERSFLVNKSVEKIVKILVGIMMICFGIFMSLRYIFRIL